MQLGEAQPSDARVRHSPLYSRARQLDQLQRLALGTEAQRAGRHVEMGSCAEEPLGEPLGHSPELKPLRAANLQHQKGGTVEQPGRHGGRHVGRLQFVLPRRHVGRQGERQVGHLRFVLLQLRL